MSGSGREALPDVRGLSGGPSKCPEMVGRPSRMSGSGWEAVPDVGSGQETLQDIRILSGGPAGC